MQKEVLVLSALMLAGGLVSCGGNQQQDKMEMKQEMTTTSNDTIMKQFTKENLYWVREPKRYSITDSVITIETQNRIQTFGNVPITDSAMTMHPCCK